MTASKSEIPTVATKLHDLLYPLDSAKRKLAIRAALTMLGDDGDVVGEEKSKKGNKERHSDDDDAAFDGGLHARAKAWKKSHQVSDDALSQVFHVENGAVEIIVSAAPGNNAKAQTINTYVLTGIAKLLETGDSKFDDKLARANCKKLGCYNEANHASYMKDKGNVLGGSKAAGWTLTAPGLKAGAELVKPFGSE